MNVFIKLWRGELPLYITFWLFGMILGTIVSVLVTNYALESAQPSPYRPLWLFVALIYTGFMCVALWRSATNYKGAAVWSIAARFYSAILFMSFVSFCVDLFHVI